MIKTMQRGFRHGLWAAVLTMLASCAASRPGVEPAVPATPANNPGVQIEHRQETFTFEAKLTRIKIVNHYGDVRFRSSDQDEVVLNSIIQRIGTPAREPHFAIEKGADFWELRVGFADDAPDSLVDTRRGRVDLVVFVPSRIKVDAETQSGTLQVAKFKGDIRARTRSGRLVASSWSRLDLQTLDGKIFARQLGNTFAGTSRISSDRGDIFIAVPVVGDYLLSIKAPGGVALTDAWKPGEMEVPQMGVEEFEHRHGAHSDRLIQVQTGAKVTLAPVILSVTKS